MVTTVILPASKKLAEKGDNNINPIELFEEIEGRFAWQAKVTTSLTGLSGLYLLVSLNAWDRFALPQYWWLHAMIFVWLLFTIILFILEPLVLHKLYHHYGKKQPEKTLRFIHRMHWVLLTVSLITIAGAVSGGHGWFWVG